MAQSMHLLQPLCRSPVCLVKRKEKFHQKHPSACRQINGNDRGMGRGFQLRTGDACSWDALFSLVSQSLVSHASWTAAAGMAGAAWCHPPLLLCPVPSMGWHWDAEQAPCEAPSCLPHGSSLLLFTVLSVTSAGQGQTCADGGAARLSTGSHQRCSIPLLPPLLLLLFTTPSAQQPGIGRDQEWAATMAAHAAHKDLLFQGLHIPVCCCRMACCYFPALSPGN